MGGYFYRTRSELVNIYMGYDGQWKKIKTEIKKKLSMKSSEMITWEQQPTFEYCVDKWGNKTLRITKREGLPIHIYILNSLEAEDRAYEHVLRKKIEYEKAAYDFENFKKDLKKLNRLP